MRTNATDTRAVLLEQRGWLLQWLDDIAAGLTPTEGSLRRALARVDEAVKRERGQ